MIVQMGKILAIDTAEEGEFHSCDTSLFSGMDALVLGPQPQGPYPHPSAKLKQFAKELRLIYPRAQSRLNKGTYEFKQLTDACRENNVTDFMVEEKRKKSYSCVVPVGPIKMTG